MSLFTEDEEAWSVPQPTDVVDVSGAGDTSMSTLVLSHLAGATWVEAMVLANAAAGIVVGKRGTSTVTTDELLDKFPKE
jgi:bifunctional ADP-heptose synthase (sugar kinase/adenylyltransferase)